MFENFMTTAEFLNSFREYYIAIWPVLVIIQILGVYTFYLLFKKPVGYSRFISLIIAFLWLWDGIVHQFLMAVSPPSQHIPMAIMFIVQGLLILYHGSIRGNLNFAYEKNKWTSRIGLFFMVYAVVGYLIIQTIQGHPITEGGVFFSNICPFDCFTLGLLMMSGNKTPKYIVIIPLIWAVVGGLTATFAWQIWEDIILAVAGVITASVVFFRKKEISQGERKQ